MCVYLFLHIHIRMLIEVRVYIYVHVFYVKGGVTELLASASSLSARVQQQRDFRVALL